MQLMIPTVYIACWQFVTVNFNSDLASNQGIFSRLVKTSNEPFDKQSLWQFSWQDIVTSDFGQNT